MIKVLDIFGKSDASQERSKSMMTFTEAATVVLRLVGKPLHYKEVTDVAIARNLLSHVGKSPEVTMGARLAAQVKKVEKDNPLVRVKPGVFALAEWDKKTVDAGLADRTPALELLAKAEAALEEASPAPEGEESEVEGEQPAASESESSDEKVLAVLDKRAAAHTDLAEVAVPPDEEERHRAELSAGATEMFEEEDDDEQPIFGPSADEAETSSEDGEKKEGKRRRRRRRGKKRDDEDSSEESDDLPAYTVSDAPGDEVLIETAPVEVGGGSDASLTSLLESILAGYDRGRGPVAAQNLADGVKRATKGDLAPGAVGVLAAARADVALAERSGRLPRFRVAGNKVALTAWSFNRKSSERLRALDKAAAQLRDATIKALSDQLGQLPQRAFGELMQVLLSTLGVTKLQAVRRPGAHGSELHFSGVLPAGFGATAPGAPAGAGLTVAICVRRDTKDIGRERVTELRGALHHYGPAWTGWYISGGQVLSGAREEAAAAGASPVILSGRNELAELMVASGVGVVSHRIETPVLDVDLLEALSSK